MRMVFAFVLATCMSTLIAMGDIPHCDGREVKKAKCQNGVVPKGYVEASECQPPDAESNCYYWIAFHIDEFACTEPKADNGYYKTYCLDSTRVEDCYRWGKCKSVMNQGQLICESEGNPIIIKRYKKYTSTLCLPKPETPND